ncbi:hypothetical protein [Aliarcobacter cryaerophilus]|uniref:hypothetical protein n=1 Tax=Aliarcobacter cryaerophilus TaxID=28198 RepID=UPI003DA41721
MNTKIKKINGTQIVKLDHNSLHLHKNTRNINNLFKKYKDIDKYFDFIYLRIVVKNLHQAIFNLDEDNIIQILDINEFQIIKSFCNDCKEDNELLDQLEFNVILIEHSKLFKHDFFIFNTLLQFSSFIKNGKLNLENFNTAAAEYMQKNNKKYSDYILNSRKCFFNTVYGFKTIKRIRKKKSR